MTAAAARVAGLLAPARDADTPDEELVCRFVAERDEHAFAALVRRHGPMVWGVCRRVLRDEHLAEDAFQAAFVVLARRAGAISPPGAVAGWLHGVAFRVAKDARRSALRRFARERTTAELPDPAAPSTGSDDAGDLRAVIDGELDRMPAKYRELLVACDLEGRPRQPVAEALGIPEGTLSSRLTAARRMLADRLTRRGIAPAAVAVVLAGGAAVEACEVQQVLLASAARVGSDVVGTVPAPVAALADGAIRAMTTKKITTVALALAAVALCALGAAYASGFFTDPPPEKPEPPKVVNAPAPAAEKPATAGPNRILFLRDGKLATVDPDGKNEKEVARAGAALRPIEPRLSPDGKRLAVRVWAERPKDAKPEDPPRHRLYVRALDEKGPGAEVGIDPLTFAWSPDGTEIAYSGLSDAKPGEDGQSVVHGVVTVATKKTVALKLPDDHFILDWSRDGKFFVSMRDGEHKDNGRLPELHLLNRDGTENKVLTKGEQVTFGARLSPDGKRLLYSRGVLERADGKEVPNSVESLELRVLDVASGKSIKAIAIPRGDFPGGFGMPTGLCWSPDGKRIAYAWSKVTGFGDGGKDVESEFQLIVCDADGKNAATLATWKVKAEPQMLGIGLVDWR